MSQTKVFTNTTRIVSGLGSIDKLPEELKRLGCRRPALVLDEGVASLGLHEKWLPSGIDYVECGRSRVNPDLGDVKVAIERAREAQCDGVIALGGGSAICLAKAVGILM